jgi:folylpolyglutamate synthase/dihydrofolate synthase
MMTYDETLTFLYESMPVYQFSGESAYKPGLRTSIALDNLAKNPHRAYSTVHIGGTNGKGSTAHTLAAILQAAGYTVGLYTSPHLVDFRERIRVNGEFIDKEFIVDFVRKYRDAAALLSPSFFELTSTMAFDYFRHSKVDIAIIEVGLGGRLDSTNIIAPALSIITNISLDHVQYLGNTLEAIAEEKAGIIKRNTPVVIGEASDDNVRNVFLDKARAEYSNLVFAEKKSLYYNAVRENGVWKFMSADFGEIEGELGGLAQMKNSATVLASVRELIHLGWRINAKNVKDGFANVTKLTGLMGRWQTLSKKPTVVCDTGHNVGGWQYISKQLEKVSIKYGQIRMVVGMVNDKDINSVLALMPKDAEYYFTQASIERALPVSEFAALAANHGLKGNTYENVADAIAAAKGDAADDDFIFIGGSSFIVADALMCNK